jgi:RimJ/RimL family protein N-acetyltransferase
MRHGIVMEGWGYRLRPVEAGDARFIHELRADPVRARYLHRGEPGLAAQQRWLEAYFERPNDYYFVIEARGSGKREGTIGIYNLDQERGWAEWGRWIVRAGSFAAVESACLIYRAGFEVLGLHSMYCRTVTDNSATLSFHDGFGLERTRVLPRYFEMESRWLDAIEDVLTRARWDEVRVAPERKAARVASWSARLPQETAAHSYGDAAAPDSTETIQEAK